MKVASKTIIYETRDEYRSHIPEMRKQGYCETYIAITEYGYEVKWNMIDNSKWSEYKLGKVVD